MFSDGSKQDVTSLVTWSSSNPAVATISNTAGSAGLAQTLTMGSTTISANYPNGSGSTTLTVTAAAISSLAITPAGPSIALGAKQQFKATATFSDKTTQDVTSTAMWSSSSLPVATIGNASGSQGLAQAVATGTTTISASFSGQTGSSILTVTPATLSSVAVTPATPSVSKGTKQQFTAIATFSDNTTQDVTQAATWSSSNSKVATVSNANGSQGLAQSLIVGSTTISASFNGQTGVATLTVTVAVVSSIGVTPANPSIAKGTTQQFNATAIFSDGTTQDVTQTATWASSDPTVATISNTSGSNGFAQSAGAGATTISAAFGGQTGTSKLTVTLTQASSIAVTPANSSVSKGLAQQFTATASFDNGTTQDVTKNATWGSSNTKIASISNAQGSNGVATALGPGITTISATYGGAFGSSQLTIPDVSLTAIQVTPTNPQLPVGFNRQFTATGLYSDNTKQDITTQVSWLSADTTVATVSNTAGSQGVATGAKTGSVLISASLGSMSGSTLLAVSSATLNSVQVTPFGSSIPAGTTLQFAATGIFSDHTTLDLTTQVSWQSSSTPVVSISNATGSNGLATGIAQGGPISITAQSLAQSGAATTTVPAVTLKSISIAAVAGTTRLPQGLTLQFTATGTYSDGSSKDLTNAVTWQSSNTAVTSISNAAGSNGLASGVGPGTTVISAAGSSVNSNAINLTVSTAVLQSIALSPAGSTGPLGLSQQFTATGTYSDSSQRDVTGEVIWQSSDSTIASVSNAGTNSGLVTTLKQGTATITATDGSVSQHTTQIVTGATLASITLTPANASVAVNASQQFNATGKYSDSTTQDLTARVTWSSTDASIADVGNSPATRGSAFAKSRGSVTVTATDAGSGVSGTTQLTVAGP